MTTMTRANHPQRRNNQARATFLSLFFFAAATSSTALRVFAVYVFTWTQAGDLPPTIEEAL